MLDKTKDFGKAVGSTFKDLFYGCAPFFGICMIITILSALLIYVPIVRFILRIVMIVLAALSVLFIVVMIGAEIHERYRFIRAQKEE